MRHDLRSYLFPFLVSGLLCGPVLAGLTGVLLQAFGHFPQAGIVGPSLDPFRGLFAWAGLGASVRLSVFTGLTATAASLAITVAIVAGWHGTRAFGLLRTALAPLLSVPHAAVAFALAFLIAPSGLISRLLSPWATGWTRPPDILILNDPAGLSLIAGLVVKEVPFLLLMTLAALNQTNPTQSTVVARSLGYGRVAAWCKTVFPPVYRQIRLPVYVVLAYSMSVVDAAIILGPTTPPSLSVMIVRWAADPDIAMRTQASAAAIIQLALVIAGLVGWRLAESLVARLGRRWIQSGDRGLWAAPIGGFGLVAGTTSVAIIVLGLCVLALWSVSGFWGFPSVVPDSLSFRGWSRQSAIAWDRLGTTSVIALSATMISVVLVIGLLQSRASAEKAARWSWLIYIPLIVPQTAFLPGLQTLLLAIGADRGLFPVIMAHCVFVLPYVLLSLSDPWRAWDSRLGVIASALGAARWRVFWQIRLPMILGAVLIASAVGLAVSVGQYLPTLLVGGGRVATLTTESLALASGGDRQAIGIFALLQTLAALFPFAVALAVPRVIWRNRRGMSHG